MIIQPLSETGRKNYDSIFRHNSKPKVNLVRNKPKRRKSIVIKKKQVVPTFSEQPQILPYYLNESANATPPISTQTPPVIDLEEKRRKENKEYNQINEPPYISPVAVPPISTPVPPIIPPPIIKSYLPPIIGRVPSMPPIIHTEDNTDFAGIYKRSLDIRAMQQNPHEKSKRSLLNRLLTGAVIATAVIAGYFAYNSCSKQPEENSRDKEKTELQSEDERRQIDLMTLGDNTRAEFIVPGTVNFADKILGLNQDLVTKLSNNYSTATNELAKTKRELEVATTSYSSATNELQQTRELAEKNWNLFTTVSSDLNLATNQLARTEEELNKVSLDFTIRGEVVKNLSSKLVDAKIKAEVATTSYSSATNQLAKYVTKEKAERQAEEQRIETGEIVDSFVSSLNLRFPLAIARVNKEGKRVGTIVEIPYHGDKFVDTYDELNALAKASRHYNGDNVDDEAVDRMFARAKGLSIYGKVKLFENVDRTDLNSLAAMSEKTNPKEAVRFRGKDGNDYLMGTLEQIGAIK